MNIVVCDDNEILLRDVVKKCKSYMKSEDTITDFTDSLKLKEYILKEKPIVDLFLLDIEMPEMSGIELKELISNVYEETNIAFLSGHSEMMPDAYGKKVVAFLSRFNNEDKLRRIIEDIRKEIEDIGIVEISDGQKSYTIHTKKIFCVKAERIYTIMQQVQYFNEDKREIYLKDITFRISLKKWEKVLDEIEFCRLNRSTIISWKYVEDVTDCVKMKNGVKYRIPAGKVKQIKHQYFQFIKKHARAY